MQFTGCVHLFHMGLLITMSAQTGPPLKIPWHVGKNRSLYNREDYGQEHESSQMARGRDVGGGRCERENLQSALG